MQALRKSINKEWEVRKEEGLVEEELGGNWQGTAGGLGNVTGKEGREIGDDDWSELVGR